MADKTKIEWSEATWSPITGCSMVSPGCTHCYAMTLAAGRLRNHPSRKGLTRDTPKGPVWTGEVRFNEQWLYQPLRWKKPRRIFVVAHGDLFHQAVPDGWIDRVFAVMAMAGHHQFQVLSKRSYRMRKYMNGEARKRVTEFMMANPPPVFGSWPRYPQVWPLPNVWMGTSVENQPTADDRIPDILATPAAVRWISIEPLLAPTDPTSLGGMQDSKGKAVLLDSLTGRWSEPHLQQWYALDWVVVGGESGPGYRPMDPDWARTLRDQCHSSGVAFFMKQMAGKTEIPVDLRIRQYPWSTSLRPAPNLYRPS